MLMVAEVCGLDASHVRPIYSAPSVPLPRDTCLDCSRLEGLINMPKRRTRFRTGLGACLAPWRCVPSPIPAAIDPVVPMSHPKQRADGGETDGFPDDPEREFREELKARGAALQELFWQELERTRNRLREAGFVNSKSHLDLGQPCRNSSGKSWSARE